MDSKIKNRIIEVCRKEDILAYFSKRDRDKNKILFFRLAKDGRINIDSKVIGHIDGNHVILDCANQDEDKYKFYNIVLNVLNKEV